MPLTPPKTIHYALFLFVLGLLLDLELNSCSIACEISNYKLVIAFLLDSCACNVVFAVKLCRLDTGSIV